MTEHYFCVRVCRLQCEGGSCFHDNNENITETVQ